MHIFLFLTFVFGFKLLHAPDNGSPNVLIIYADDQGSIDLGVLGAKDLSTPNLDRLAAEGLLLTQMYAPAPVCSASRAGLLTGRFPARAGQPANGPLDGDEITIAECFGKAGYRTGHVGKWHLGKALEQRPSGQGFQDWFGHLNGCIDNYSHFFYWNGPNRHDLYDNGVEIHRPGEYFPDLMAKRCKKFVGADDDRPWLLYWAINAPHYPYQGTPKWLQYYSNSASPRKEYCAWISSMDETIGSVVEHLRASGQLDNTIVVFQADHGHSTEERAFGGGGNSGIFRGAKFSLFEGGIRVPSIIRYPARLPSGEIRKQFFHGCDWFPTLSEMCGVPLPVDSNGKPTKLDGISIRETLANDENMNRPPVYWQMGSGDDPQRCIRNGRWKLITNPRDTSVPQRNQKNDGKLEVKRWLSDISSDPSESTNLADTNPEVVREMMNLEKELRDQWPDEK